MNTDSRVHNLVLAISLSSLVASNALAVGLEGHIENQDGRGQAPRLGASTQVLQGNLRDTAALQSSLHVTPGAANGKLLEVQTTQYAGGRKIEAGQSTPHLRGISPMSDYGSPHSIAPITTYRLTPRNGVMNFGAEPQVSQPGQSKAVMYWGGSSSITPARQHESGLDVPPPYVCQAGVTTAPGYSVAKLTGYGVGGGGGNIESGWTFNPFNFTATTRSGVSFRTPGTQVSVVSSIPGKSSYDPGYRISVSGSRNGVVTYAPGYEVSLSTGTFEKMSLGAQWSIPSNNPSTTTDGSGTLQAKNLSGTLLPDVRPIRAKALLSPALLPSPSDKTLDWQHWYARVANAIYKRWQYAEVGPGLAKVRVTAKRASGLSFQIVDFVPAPGVEREAAAETAFRETALRAVNQVTDYELPSFPESSTLDTVSFDVDMKRLVDGPQGFDVATVSATKP